MSMPSQGSRLALAAALVLGLLIVSCAPASEPTRPAPAAGTASTGAGAPPTATPALVPVTVSYSGLAPAQSPAWIGVDGGYFAGHGLDVRLVHIASSPQSTAALLAGEVDVSVVGGQGIIAAALGGSDTLIIGALNNSLNGQLVGSERARTMDELRGKRIATSRRGSIPYYIMRLGVLRYGLDPDRDVIGIQTPGAVESVGALISGAVDAAALNPPFDQQTIDQGYPALFNSSRAGVKWATTQIATTRPQIARRADVLQSIIDGLAESVQRYKTDKPFALEVIARYTMADSVGAIEAGYDVEARSMLEDLRPDLTAVQAILTEIADEYPAAASAQPGDFVDFRFVDRLATPAAAR